MLWTRLLRQRGTSATPFVRLPSSAHIHPFGTPSNTSPDGALLRFPRQGWTVDDGGKEGWAIVGDADGRRLAVETLLGRHRILPNSPPPGPLPVNALSAPARAVDPDTWTPVRYLAFARPSNTGEFTDYTARYGALQEEDKQTLRERLGESFGWGDDAQRNVLAALDLMSMTHLIDMPAISLSSGQTRRVRIAQAIMTLPQLLVLEDPMAGLDVRSRATVDNLLGEMNSTPDQPRVVLVLRDKGEETLSPWTTHVCEVKNGNVWVGTRGEWEERRRAAGDAHTDTRAEGTSSSSAPPIVKMKDVSVTYGEGARPVLKNVNWDIRPGDRWHLQGANGSGKTTLLSVLLGQHPQSYSMPASALTLFDHPRRNISTAVLRTRIGHSSPEVFAAFPRNMALTAAQAIATGYEGIFSRRPITEDQKVRILSLLEFFKPHLATTRTGKPANMSTRELANRQFAHYSPPQQALLVFLRAVASRPPLLVLDEPTQGVDEAIWERCFEFLRQEWDEMRAEGKEQAVVVVSHYDDEVPWKHGKVLRLDDGVATVH